MAQDLRRRLREDRKTEGVAGVRARTRSQLPRVVYNQSTVAATLYFEDLIRVALPMTDWWARLDGSGRSRGSHD